MKKIYIFLTLLVTFFSFTQKEYAITNININNNKIIPEFDKNTKVYNVFVNKNIQIITINVTKEENEVVTGSGSVSLKKGLNVIEIISYINDTQVEKYTLNITRGEYVLDKKDATLSSLKVGSFDINFDSNTFSYEIDAPTSKRLNITYEATNPSSKVKLKGDVDLNKKENIIEVIVTSQDKKHTNTYTLKINTTKEKNKGVENKESIFDEKEFSPFELKLIIIGIIAGALLILGILFYIIFIKTKYNYKIIYKPVSKITKKKPFIRFKNKGKLKL